MQPYTTENAHLIPDLTDGPSAYTTSGRLVINEHGLFFVSGATVDRSAYAETKLANGYGAEACALVGDALLQSVKALPPEEQVRRVHGSVHIASDDLDTVSLPPIVGNLKVVTTRRGDIFKFKVPFAGRATVRKSLQSMLSGRRNQIDYWS